MNIKKRLGKEENTEVIIESKKTKNKLRVNEDDTLELLRLIPVVYEVLDSVMDRKYPYVEVLVDDNYLGLKVDLDYTELKRRIYKIGFKKKILVLTEVLPELLSNLMANNKDFFILNGLRCAKIDGVVYIGSDYSENTILLTYIEEKLFTILIDKVNIPFKYEMGRQEIVEELETSEESEEAIEQTQEALDYARKKDILNRLIDTTNEVLKESIESDELKNEEESKNEGQKLTSENISLANLSAEEQKRLEDEVLESLNSL